MSYNLFGINCAISHNICLFPVCCETPKTLLVSEKDAEMVLILNTGASLDRADYSGFSLTYRVCKRMTKEIE